MKKNILKITFAAALAVVAGVTAYQAQNKECPVVNILRINIVLVLR